MSDAQPHSRRRTLLIFLVIVAACACIGTWMLWNKPRADDRGKLQQATQSQTSPVANAIVQPNRLLMLEVIDVDQSLVPRAQVTVFRRDGRREVLETDDNGVLEIIDRDAAMELRITKDGMDEERFIPQSISSDAQTVAATVTLKPQRGLRIVLQDKATKTVIPFLSTETRVSLRGKRAAQSNTTGPLRAEVLKSALVRANIYIGDIEVCAEVKGYRPLCQKHAQVSDVAESFVFDLERSPTVTGRVTSTKDGSPVANARIIVTRGTVTTADADGNFVLSTLPTGPLSLRVTANGFIALDLAGIDGSRMRGDRLDVELTPADGSAKAEVMGIGVMLGNSQGKAVVAQVFDGSPGKAAGLEPGDVITHVDGTEVTSSNMAVPLIRGPEHTQVRLTVQKKNKTTHEVSVERGRVKAPIK